MTTSTATQSTQALQVKNTRAPSLAHETHELDALHAGLVRHLAVWRDAHETAVMRLGAVMARMDAVIARVEQERERLRTQR